MLVLKTSRADAVFAMWHCQDTGKRKAIDADREDARLRRLAEEMATQQERERQWRVARGTATAEDMRGPIRAGPAQRDTWMTDLPEARRPNAQPSQVNVVSARCLSAVTPCNCAVHALGRPHLAMHVPQDSALQLGTVAAV